MPEAAIDKDGHSGSREDDIGADAGRIVHQQSHAVPETASMEFPPDCHLCCCVPVADAGHPLRDGWR